VTDRDQLQGLPRKSPLFALHLSAEAVRLAGDDDPPPVAWGGQHREIATRRALSRIDAARHEVAVWGADNSSAQTMVFAAVKEWAMLQAALSGRPEFERRFALSALIQRGAQGSALAELEEVWLARREGRPSPAVRHPERVLSDALDLVPA
jgi:hypothetical protein